jgi:hypothetical protein
MQWLINSYCGQIEILGPVTSATRMVSQGTMKMALDIPPSGQKQGRFHVV